MNDAVLGSTLDKYGLRIFKIIVIILIISSVVSCKIKRLVKMMFSNYCLLCETSSGFPTLGKVDPIS